MNKPVALLSILFTTAALLSCGCGLGLNTSSTLRNERTSKNPKVKQKNRRDKAPEPSAPKSTPLKADFNTDPIGVFTPPSKIPHDPVAASQLTKAARNLSADQVRLQQLYKHHDPAALPYLINVAGNDYNPLAVSALYLLGRYPQQQTINFLSDKVKSSKPKIRSQSMRSLCKIDREAGLKQARRMLRDNDVTVRSAAIMAVGEYQDRKAQAQLLRMNEEKNPQLQVALGWALMQCGAQIRGAQILKLLSRRNDPAVAVKAMLALTNTHDAQTVRIMIDNLYRQNQKVNITAAAILNNMPPLMVSKVLSTYPQNRAAAIKLRLNATGYMLGKKSYPKNCSQLLGSQHYQDRTLAFDCIQKEGRTQDIPALINQLESNLNRIRERATLVLLHIIQKNSLPQAPDDVYSSKSWRKWWLHQHHVLAATYNRAIIATPNGKSKEVQKGGKLDFDSVITKITAGQGPQRNEGAMLEVICNGYPVIIGN